VVEDVVVAVDEDVADSSEELVKEIVIHTMKYAYLFIHSCI